jgi:hypothetical protein
VIQRSLPRWPGRYPKASASHPAAAADHFIDLAAALGRQALELAVDHLIGEEWGLRQRLSADAYQELRSWALSAAVHRLCMSNRVQ